MRAIRSEWLSHLENGTFRLVRKPPNAKVIGSKWVFKIKEVSDGRIGRFKVRLVAQGFGQRPGVDFHETYAPTLSYTILRLILLTSVQAALPVWHIDVKTAFLIPDLPKDEQIYMRLPRGDKSLEPGSVLLLLKSLYGLKQAGFLWSKEFTATLRKLGYVPLAQNPCVFIKTVDNVLVAILGVFVDDGILCCSKETFEKDFAFLEKHYKMSNLGTPDSILGIRTQFREPLAPTALFLSQRTYAIKILARVEMEECNVANTPCPTTFMLSKADLAQTEEERLAVAEFPYRSVVGMLMFLMICTRPDMAYAVSCAAMYSHDPGRRCVTYVKHILRYLKRTLSLGILYERDEARPKGTFAPFDIFSFADASFACDPDTRRSRSGGCALAALGTFLWFSRRQGCISLSTCESELNAFVEILKELVYLKPILVALKVIPANYIFEVNQDNMSTISMSKTHQITKRNKYYGAKLHWACEKVEQKFALPIYRETTQMVADVFTKALSRVLTNRFCTMLGMCGPPFWAVKGSGPISAVVSHDKETFDMQAIGRSLGM
jgi:hypothetical protein